MDSETTDLLIEEMNRLNEATGRLIVEFTGMDGYIKEADERIVEVRKWLQKQDAPEARMAALVLQDTSEIIFEAQSILDNLTNLLKKQGVPEATTRGTVLGR